MFEGRFENYIKAKELLAEHIVGESLLLITIPASREQ
jgi:hypothetical protein